MIYYNLIGDQRLNTSQIQAIKALYFRGFPKGTQTDLAERLDKAGYTLVELEYFARRLKSNLQLIKDWIGKTTDQDNLLCYAVEIYSKMEWDSIGLDPERKQLIRTIRSVEGIQPKSPKKRFTMKLNTINQAPQSPTYLDDLELQVLEEDMEREFDQLMRRLAEIEDSGKNSGQTTITPSKETVN